ncbi:cupin domain-containing protein [Inhella sp.]|uniref:cupin domain-containing protein n=1 Tax=Inhella sp. TaxID=1921806 RepID=UPI0035AF4039
MNADALRAQLIRNWNEVELEAFERAPLYASRTGGLTDGTAARQLGAAIDIVPPGKQACPYHFHYAQEEMFVILEGEGVLRVAGERVPVRAGDVITLPAGPEFPHHLLNTGTRELKYLSISTQQRPEVCEYPDSGKVGAYPGAAGPRFMGRRAPEGGQGLDYWDGEP